MAKTVYRNKKGLYNYTVLDKLEAGIQLQGWEVKSVKSSMISMDAAFINYSAAGELELVGASIAPWKTGDPKNTTEQTRTRKLLVKKAQAARLGGMASRPGYTLIPLELIINDRGLVKLIIALVKGKKQYQKKNKIKERDLDRQMQRESKYSGF